jgi:saccharopine dehydrogenase-like NADP-dependent oxidoreductase
MKVIVLGGTGFVGRAAVRDLINSDDVSEVQVADVNSAELNLFVDELKSEKVSPIQVDVTDHHELVETIKGADAVLDSTLRELYVVVAKAAIEAKVNGCVIGFGPDIALEMLKLDSLAKDAGVTYVVSAGCSPGSTNVLARYLSAKMDQVEDIRIYFHATRRPGESPALLDGFLTEIPSAKLTYENGELKEVPPWSGREEVEFPEPFGKQVLYHVVHSEPATIPMHIKGVKNVSAKGCWSPHHMDMLRMWDDVGLLGTNPIDVGGKEIAPKDLLSELLLRRVAEEGKRPHVALQIVRVTGKKNGAKADYVMHLNYFPIENDPEGTLARATGFSGAIIARMLARGDVKEKGVMGPEACIDPERLIQELVERADAKIYEIRTEKKKFSRKV